MLDQNHQDQIVLNMSSIPFKMIQNADIELEHRIAPSVLYKPTLTKDGDQWCALLGEDIMVGLCAFGKTPREAMANFDAAFNGVLDKS